MIKTKTPSGKARWSLELYEAPSPVGPLPSRPCPQRQSHPQHFVERKRQRMQTQLKISARSQLFCLTTRPTFLRSRGLWEKSLGSKISFTLDFPAFRCLWAHRQHLLDEATTVAQSLVGTLLRVESRFTQGRVPSLHCLFCFPLEVNRVVVQIGLCTCVSVTNNVIRNRIQFWQRFYH